MFCLCYQETRQSVFGPRDEKYIGDLQVYLAQQNLEIVAEDAQLEGEHRVAVDGFLSNEQCNELIELASVRNSDDCQFSPAVS